MKKIIISSSLIILGASILPISAHAYYLPPDPYGLGTEYNPIHIEIQEDPIQRDIREMERHRIEFEQRSAKNETTVNRLKSQYGVSAFYSCYAGANKDTSDPSTKASYLIS